MSILRGRARCAEIESLGRELGVVSIHLTFSWRRLVAFDDQMRLSFLPPSVFL